MLIALQLGVTHWFYLYIVWFFPLVLVALLGRYGEPERRARGRRGAAHGAHARPGMRTRWLLAAAAALAVVGVLATTVGPTSRHAASPTSTSTAGTPTRLDAGRWPYRASPSRVSAARARADVAGRRDRRRQLRLYEAASGRSCSLAALAVMLPTVRLARRRALTRRRWIVLLVSPLLAGAVVRTHFDLVAVALMLWRRCSR